MGLSLNRYMLIGVGLIALLVVLVVNIPRPQHTVDRINADVIIDSHETHYVEESVHSTTFKGHIGFVQCSISSKQCNFNQLDWSGFKKTAFSMPDVISQDSTTVNTGLYAETTDRRYLYYVAGSCGSPLVVIDTVNMAYTRTSLSECLSQLQYDTSNFALVGIGNSKLLKIDAHTGASESIGSLTNNQLSTGSNSISAFGNGKLFVMNSETLHAVSTTDANQGSVKTSERIMYMFFHSARNKLFGIVKSDTQSSLKVVTIDSTTGKLDTQFEVPLDSATNFVAASYSQNGEHMAFLFRNRLLVYSVLENSVVHNKEIDLGNDPILGASWIEHSGCF